MEEQLQSLVLYGLLALVALALPIGILIENSDETGDEPLTQRKAP